MIEIKIIEDSDPVIVETDVNNALMEGWRIMAITASGGWITYHLDRERKVVDPSTLVEDYNADS